ncbi:MAG: phage terminase large subunit [Patescibacteria group bacterium]|nr:phage terminase large subunit [Patescibacteria group bacterium]
MVRLLKPPGSRTQLFMPLSDTERIELLALLLQRDARRLEGSLKAFVLDAWRILEPGAPFVDGVHIDAICEYLEAVTAGTIKRLIINIPPRHSKSSLVSIMWPCWMWARNPQSRWMFASYSAGLAEDHSVSRRTVLSSTWYQERWGERFRLAADQNQKREFANSRRGRMIATSVGGTATGKGGDVVVIDDPHSVEQALSETERKTGVRWVRQTAMTRLDQPESGAVVIVMQRLHEDDVSGSFLRDGGWEHLCLPSEAEQNERIQLPSTGRVLERAKGDLLSPERFSREVLAAKRIEIGSYAYAGQYQQRPSPAEGGLLKRAWWRRYTALPERFDQVLQSWDCSFKDTDGSDFVCGLVIGRVGADKYVLDCAHGRFDYPATRRAVREMRAAWPQTTALLIEDKANGPAIISELRHEISGVIPIEPEGGKLARAHACSPEIEAGNVYLPNSAWADALIEECAAFPTGAHDDRVDALTQALNWMRKRGGGLLGFAAREMAEKERMANAS